jgi:hypothetical protein
MTTPLNRTLKRQVSIKGRLYVVALSPEGIAVTLKRKRKGQVLRWEDLVSGDAALAVALNASLSQISAQSDEARPKRKGKGKAKSPSQSRK